MHNSGLEQTIFILEVLQGQGLNSVDDRSKWLINLRSSKTENKVSIDGKTPVIEAWKLAEAVIDVCYNLTVEDSIYNVSKHNMGFEFSESFDSKTGKKNYIISEDFLFDLKNRLEEYFDLENGGIHTFLDDETTEGNVYTGFLPDWASAVRIVKRKKGQTEKSKTNDIPLYENEDKKSTNSWRRKNIKYLGIAFTGRYISFHYSIWYYKLTC